MGMDVYGKNPATETGEYFRNNVWAWHPLWEYCEVMHGDIARKVAHAHSNDGDGLDADDAFELGTRLARDVADGRAQEYIDARNARLASLPKHDCMWCNGTGIRSDKVGVDMGMPTAELPLEDQIVLGRLTGTCNACRGHGWEPDFETHYELWLENIDDFSNFLRDSGGFRIW